ncbi:MAG: hypothetical protein [Olavius algarvensis Delta 4 endosymbiont]|nr:MAG: hypothetical protein [Olavius algarvensis Delta 4 endosymbiont]
MGFWQAVNWFQGCAGKAAWFGKKHKVALKVSIGHKVQVSLCELRLTDKAAERFEPGKTIVL